LIDTDIWPLFSKNNVCYFWLIVTTGLEVFEGLRVIAVKHNWPIWSNAEITSLTYFSTSISHNRSLKIDAQFVTFGDLVAFGKGTEIAKTWSQQLAAS
jgi:ABC-type long-subunit fatty acid transport system fused permease/ATPase subunit